MKILLIFCILLVLIQSKVTTAQCGRSNANGCDNVQPCFDPFGVPVSPTCFEACNNDDDCIDGEGCRTLGTCGMDNGDATPCTFGCDACLNDGDGYICLCYDGCPRVNGVFPRCSDATRSQCVGEEFQHPDIPDETGPSLLPSCLSAYSQVHVHEKGPIFLKDVKQGDKVLVSRSSSSSFDDSNDASLVNEEYEELYGFGHSDVYTVAIFLQLKTASNKDRPLEITGEHLVMKQKSSPTSTAAIPVRADSIQVGDVLIGNQGGVGEKVIEISSVRRQGLYSPLVKNGKILVSGLQVSSYTAVQHDHPESFMVGCVKIMPHHFMSHAAIAPFRMMCLLGDDFLHICKQRNADGRLLFANEGDNLTSWIMEQAVQVQGILLSLLLPCILYSYYMEQYFCGGGRIPMILLYLFAIGYSLAASRFVSKKLVGGAKKESMQCR